MPSTKEFIFITGDYIARFPEERIIPSVRQPRQLSDGSYEVDVEYQFVNKTSVIETYVYVGIGQRTWELKL